MLETWVEMSELVSVETPWYYRLKCLWVETSVSHLSWSSCRSFWSCLFQFWSICSVVCQSQFPTKTGKQL